MDREFCRLQVERFSLAPVGFSGGLASRGRASWLHLISGGFPSGASQCSCSVAAALVVGRSGSPMEVRVDFPFPYGSSAFRVPRVLVWLRVGRRVRPVWPVELSLYWTERL